MKRDILKADGFQYFMYIAEFITYMLEIKIIHKTTMIESYAHRLYNLCYNTLVMDVLFHQALTSSGKEGRPMRKFLKTSIALCLLCGLLTATAFAGNVSYERYYMGNSGTSFVGTGSSNTKTAAGKNWFIQVKDVGFSGANTSGTYGMAHAPCINLVQKGATFWTKVPTAGFNYIGWLPGCGDTLTYFLGVRLDSLITGTSGAYTVGVWNSN